MQLFNLNNKNIEIVLIIDFNSFLIDYKYKMNLNFEYFFKYHLLF